MTEEKHTPGPWVWRGKDGSLRQKGEPPYAYGKSVLRPEYEYDSGLDTVVSGADARLIAAAPDMLEALKGARETIIGLKNARWSEAEGSDAEWVKEIDAAIAKATGAP